MITSPSLEKDNFFNLRNQQQQRWSRKILSEPEYISRNGNQRIYAKHNEIVRNSIN